jgi:hypothetical protein
MKASHSIFCRGGSPDTPAAERVKDAKAAFYAELKGTPVSGCANRYRADVDDDPGAARRIAEICELIAFTTARTFVLKTRS